MINLESIGLLRGKTRVSKEKYEYYKNILKRCHEIIPKEKKVYWFNRIAKCASIGSKIKICEDLIKHYKE